MKLSPKWRSFFDTKNETEAEKKTSWKEIVGGNKRRIFEGTGARAIANNASYSSPSLFAVASLNLTN